MKINDQRQKAEVCVSELSAGDTFEHNGNIYMKTDSVEDSYCIIYNAVDLGVGTLEAIKDDVCVQKLNCELTVL